MTNKIEAPEWYPLPVYNRELTPEEWLHEIFKRSKLNEILADPFMNQVTKLEKFKSIILRNEIVDIRTFLCGQLGQPIRDMSVAEILYIAELIKQDKSFSENPDTKILESAIQAKALNMPLNDQQQAVLSRFYDIPWHSSHKETNNKNWYPRIPYLTGAPVTINANFSRTDVIGELRKLLTRWVDKKKPDISKKVFSTWTQKSILAIFDLRVWYKINGIEIPKIELARLLWPNPPASKKKKATTVYLDDYIDEAISLSERNIHDGNVSMLFQTCESRKFLRERIGSLKEKSIMNSKLQPE